MDKIRRKIEKSLNLSASHHGKHRKIVIVPDNPGTQRHSEQSCQINDSNCPPISSSSTSKACHPSLIPEVVSKKESKHVFHVPVGQLLDLTPSPLCAADPTWSWTTSESFAPASKLLLCLPTIVQYKVFSYLPFRDLLHLSQVNRRLYQSIQEEVHRRETNWSMQFIWRKDFIRFMNQSYLYKNDDAKKIRFTRNHVFGPVWNELYFRPEFLIVCYSPDLFEYEIRLQMNDDNNPQTSHSVFHAETSAQECITVKEKAGTILDQAMKQVQLRPTSIAGCSCVWHMRLFTVLQPGQNTLWSSEDLLLLFFPTNTFTTGRIEYSDLMAYPMLERYYANGNMLTAMIAMLQHRHQPRFLMLSARDLTLRTSIAYPFPIIICDISPFPHYPNEYLCLSGKDVKVYQTVLEGSESRPERDEKIRALRECCGNIVSDTLLEHISTSTTANGIYGKDARWILFYLTEMWPGGTSKECPTADITLLRRLFPGIVILGGRGKHFMANQILFDENTDNMDHQSGVLARLSIPTIISAISFK